LVTKSCGKQEKKRAYASPQMEHFDFGENLMPLLAGSDNSLEKPHDYEDGGEGFIGNYS